jgi:hypothetical protein
VKDREWQTLFLRDKKIKSNFYLLKNFDTLEIEGKADFDSTASITVNFRAWVAHDQ